MKIAALIGSPRDDGNSTRLLPAKLMDDYTLPDPMIPRIPRDNHWLDWINAIKQGRTASSDFEYAVPLTKIVNLGIIAMRAGEKVDFDMAQSKITNSASANQFLGKEYRKGFDWLPL